MELLDNTLNLRNARDIEIKGEYQWNGPPNVPMVDMTGALGCRIPYLRLHAEKQAGCGLLLARPASEYSGGNHRFDNLNISGNFQSAAMVNVGSEANTFFHPSFHRSTGNSCTVWMGTRKPAELISPYGDIPPGGLLSQLFVGAQVTADGGNATGVIFIADKFVMGDISWIGGGVTMNLARSYRSAFGLYMSGLVNRQWRFQDIRLECEKAVLGWEIGDQTRPEGFILENNSIMVSNSCFQAMYGPIYNLRMNNNLFISQGNFGQWGRNVATPGQPMEMVRAHITVRELQGAIIEQNNSRFDVSSPTGSPATHTLHILDKAENSVISVDPTKVRIR